MATRPTLIVGLGTSGMRIASEVEKLMYATFGANSLPNCRSIYIETDTSARPDRTPIETELKPATIAVDRLETALSDLKQNAALDLDWVPEEIARRMAYKNEGAGGVRPGGRILLWYPPNFKSVYNALAAAWAEVTRGSAAAGQNDLAEEGTDQHCNVFVVGTLVGGTCSGTFIDIGYMLRKITTGGRIGVARARQVSLTAILLVPSESASSVGCANGYGALYELEQFRLNGHPYDEQWPNGMFSGSWQIGPFDSAYLVSTEYGDGAGAIELVTCYTVTAMKLFCDVIGMSGEIGRVTSDGRANQKYGYFSTFGISAVMYPRYALCEAAGCDLGVKLCDRFLDEQQLFDDTGKVLGSIGEPNIYDEAAEFIGRILDESFSQLESRGTQVAMAVDVERDIQRVLNGEMGVIKFSEKFLIGDSNNYWGVINDNLHTIRESFLDSVSQLIRKKLRDSQNLISAEMLLKKIQTVIAETLDYWLHSDVPQPAQWATEVNRMVKQVFTNTHRFLLQRTETVRDRAEEMVKIMKMMAMREILSGLAQAIDSKDPSIVRVPTVPRMAEFRSGLLELKQTLIDRKKEIRRQVTDETVPVLRVWAKGDFESDLRQIQDRYRQTTAKWMPNLQNVFPDETPYDVFDREIKVVRDPTTNKTTAASGLLTENVKAKYQKSCEVVLLDEVDPIAFAAQHPRDTARQANRALAGLLHLRKQPTCGEHGVPRFVLGSDVNSIREMVRTLNNNDCPDFTPDQVVNLALLKDAVFFYEEKSNIEPLTTLSAIKTMKERFDNPPPDQSSGPDAVKLWKQFRLAYGITAENWARRQRRTLVRTMMRFAREFGLRYERQYGGMWIAKGPRWDTLPISSGDPPTFIYTDESKVQVVMELSPERAVSIRILAENPGAFEALRIAISKVLAQFDDTALVKIYNEEIRPRIADASTAGAVNQFSDEFFGLADESGKRQGGLISELRVSAQEGRVAYA